MRCKVVNNIKMNQQNNYDNHDCRYCEMETETQDHIYQCSERWKLINTEFQNIPKYGKIIDGNCREKVQVARILLILIGNLSSSSKSEGQVGLKLWKMLITAINQLLLSTHARMKCSENWDTCLNLHYDHFLFS